MQCTVNIESILTDICLTSLIVFVHTFCTYLFRFKILKPVQVLFVVPVFSLKHVKADVYCKLYFIDKIYHELLTQWNVCMIVALVLF